ncbi:MAG: ComEA family DNA-binding protein [Janthinobacterium lividum]
MPSLRKRRSWFPSTLFRFMVPAMLLGLAVPCSLPVRAAPFGTPVPQRTSAASPAAGPLDINVASPAELRALPGMGDVYVKRIIENRPYTAKNQLITRGILPQAAYERIRDNIVAHRPPRP